MNFLPEEFRFFLHAYSISDRNLNLVGTLRRIFFNFPNSFLMHRKNLNKNDEKTEKIRFLQTKIFHVFIISIYAHCAYAHRIYNLVIYVFDIHLFSIFQV